MDNDAFRDAMHKCIQGGSFNFTTKDSTALLHPVAFGCCCTRRNKKRLTFGEAFLGNYAINKCRRMAFGQRFVWVTDCYALKFILSYDGQNPRILRLQMRIMCWDMVIKHRNEVCLTDADYFSRLSADLCFDPLLKEYVQQFNAIHRCSLAPTELPITPMNQPYFRRPHLNMPCKLEQHPSVPRPSALTAITTTGLQHLSNWPVTFGTPAAPANTISDVAPCYLYNSDIMPSGSMLTHFNWAIYSFNSGHFLSTIGKRGLPFKVVLACNPFIHGRALFCKLSECKLIMNSAPAIRITSGGSASHLCWLGTLFTLTGTQALSLHHISGTSSPTS
jgi:hypothetical protein